MEWGKLGTKPWFLSFVFLGLGILSHYRFETELLIVVLHVARVDSDSWLSSLSFLSTGIHYVEQAGLQFTEIHLPLAVFSVTPGCEFKHSWSHLQEILYDCMYVCICVCVCMYVLEVASYTRLAMKSQRSACLGFQIAEIKGVHQMLTLHDFLKVLASSLSLFSSLSFLSSFLCFWFL